MIGRWRVGQGRAPPGREWDRHGDRLRHRVGNVLEPEHSEPDGASQAGRSRRLTAFGTGTETHRLGREAQPAAWAAEGHEITARPFLADHARRLGRLGSSPGRLSARHRARTPRGGAWGQTRAGHSRTRDRCPPVVNPAWLTARRARSARSASRWYRVTASLLKLPPSSNQRSTSKRSRAVAASLRARRSAGSVSPERSSNDAKEAPSCAMRAARSASSCDSKLADCTSVSPPAATIVQW